jgi:malate dehydrogenase (oxaloacetate-decarboxylating)(NADP+)
MAERPIVFALANPDPEISHPEARAARPDAIVATGRSDYPNQVNNVLGFPFIFRGALDVRARGINEEMKLAAAHALAALAREDVPESVARAYGGEQFELGPDYIIPKPFDPRVLLWVAPAVARAAIETGVARVPLDLDAYRDALQDRLSRRHQVMGAVFAKTRKRPAKVVLDDGEHARVLQAAHILRDEGICEPLLLGSRVAIEAAIVEHKLEDELEGVTIVDPSDGDRLERYAETYWTLRQRHGVNREVAEKRVRRRAYFAALMVAGGEADGMVTGLRQSYPEAVRPALEIIRTRPGRRAGGVYIVVTRNDFKFLADCTMNPEPSAEELAEVAVATADLARDFDVTPRVALLSYSNFGNSDAGESPARVRRAVALARELRPDLELDGEMQVDAALVAEERLERYPFSALESDANVLVFPSLDAANIAYKLLWRFGGAEVIGPILLGMNKPVNVLQQNAGVTEIVNLAALTALRARL